MERVIYHLNGVEPIAWRLDPSLKAESLAVGWFPFDRVSDDEAAAGLSVAGAGGGGGGNGGGGGGTSSPSPS